ncbi:leucyl aminopeptidase family protein [Bacillaceae bacterium SIJ1]|uniref:M17 family metallopeptidase n=1 Tax=Litoribacterium kuwaitense TaxID=1398745 RepID=UPI0013E9B87B|nr:leucyl aminopeptidase family protein [Litoribacterium kuwaitense]NGP45121.1 leucyl aminopeptidase family protein [Litoribacterium kuwaitense]
MKIVVRPIEKVEETEGLIIDPTMIEFGKTSVAQADQQFYLLLGMKKAEKSVEDIRFLGGETVKAVKGYTFTGVSVDFEKLASGFDGFSVEDVVTAFLEGWYLGGYQFLHYKKEQETNIPALAMDTEQYGVCVKTAQTRANAVNLTRDLCNEPANQLTPSLYADRLKTIFRDSKVQVDIIEADELEQRGFKGTATVGKGSGYPPKCAVLTFNNSEGHHVALVGKGVTFDSGGVNVKTGRDIAEMKMDMGGSAAVVGAMKLLADMNAPVHVTAVIPMVTNVAGKDAFLPSDVIKYSNGITVEVGNTDAEGRLILADGILHAQELGATTIIDIATLTGSIGHALGLKTAGIFSNCEADLWKYKAMGELTGDPVWPMPLILDYKTHLKSDCADVNNLGTSSFGGAITAAVFLHHFVEEDRKWVHIDMANTARPWKVQGYHVDGAAGFGARLLTEIVQAEFVK